MLGISSADLFVGVLIAFLYLFDTFPRRNFALNIGVGLTFNTLASYELSNFYGLDAFGINKFTLDMEAWEFFSIDGSLVSNIYLNNIYLKLN